MTEREIFESNLSHFKIKTRRNNTAQCFCPAHDDKHASLTITKGRKCILFYCHAGCTVDDVLKAAGLEKKDTFYDVEPRSPNWKAYVEGREKRKIEAVYNYFSINGSYAFTKIRLDGKKIIYGKLQNDRFTYGLGHDVGRKSYKAIYGSLQAINKALAEGRSIFIPEGEKDVDTLAKQGFTAFTYGGVNDWQSDFATLVQGAEVFILADNDEPGKRVAETIQNDIKAVAKSSKIIVPMPDTPKADITDYFNAGHTKEEFEQLLQQEQNTVKEKDTESLQLPAQAQQEQVVMTTKQNITESVLPLLEYKEIKKRDGTTEKKILQTVKNFEIILENDERFKEKIRFNEFSREPYLIGNVPWEHENNNRSWGSYDDSALFSIIQSCYGLHSRNDFYDAVKIISMQNKYHPVRELLDSLVYDGKEHIRNLFSDYLGVTKDEYSYQVVRLWMLGGVARIYQPGIKFDYTPILKGPQGLGKSTMLRLMALDDGWFNDSLDSLDSDKAAQSLMGSWIIELAELKSLARTAGGVDSVKRFLSATQDKYRTPYERRPDVFLRQNIFAGTTNKDDFLQDETGNRRFLILEAGINKPTKNVFSPESLNDIRAAWAEAVHIWKTEKPTLILPEAYKKQAEELQNENMADDGMLGIIVEYLADKQQTCAIEIWVDALNEMGRPPKWKASEINNIISKLPDWEKTSSPIRFKKYGHQRGFRKIVSKNIQQSCIQSNKDCIQKQENENYDFKSINEKTPFD